MINKNKRYNENIKSIHIKKDLHDKLAIKAKNKKAIYKVVEKRLTQFPIYQKLVIFLTIIIKIVVISWVVVQNA